MTKKSSRVESSTQWEKCSLWWKTNCTMWARSRRIMLCMRLSQLQHLQTSTRLQSTIRSKGCGQHQPPNRERLAITLRIENEKACMKLSIIRLARGMLIPKIHKGLIQRTYTSAHLWSILRLSNRHSSLATKTLSCIMTRRLKSVAIISQIFEVCRLRAIVELLSLITTDSLSYSIPSLIQHWLQQLRVALEALKMTGSCRRLAWEHRH